jgi:Bacterial regulatory helix-turn-helix protein, lysR family
VAIRPILLLLLNTRPTTRPRKYTVGPTALSIGLGLVAAAQLYVSQPALSTQIRALERRLGFPLFDRTPSGITLTVQGSMVLPAARAALAE